MSLPGKKGQDLSRLPTLNYEIKLNLPSNTDSRPQEISFLDLVANDSKFKNDKESLELVLSSYVKACGKQSVKEILAERDNMVDDNASLSDIIRALMDYNDQQNANLGIGYNDPDDDDSFIDDSTAAQDIIPRNMTNERDGFYVNEKHQPIQARYLSDSSESESEDDEDNVSDDDDDDDESDTSEENEKSKKNEINNSNDLNEKNLQKNQINDDTHIKILTTKRKRSISEVLAPTLPNNLDEKSINKKPVEEVPKKVKKLSDTSDEQSIPQLTAYVLPNEMESDIRPCVEKLAKLISIDQTTNNLQKKIERLFNTNICHELLDLVKKLHRHTNAHRQLVFDILSSKTGLCSPILVVRARSLLLKDYEPTMPSISLDGLKDKLKTEVKHALLLHIDAHNQAIKEWQQKMAENPSKDKNRGPRKSFRLYKTINELIIRCIDRKLETMTMIDSDSLELFIHEQIVPLWEQSGWMTAKKIMTEVIRIEYRPIRDSNQQPMNQVINTVTTNEKLKSDIPTNSSASKSLNTTSPSTTTATKIAQQQNVKTNENKQLSTSNNQGKSLEMATRVTTNPVKQHTPRPPSSSSSSSIDILNVHLNEHSTSKTGNTDTNRSLTKSTVISPSTQADLSTKRHSSPHPSSAIDLTMDLFSSQKKHPNESSNSTQKTHSNSSSNKELTLSQRPTSSSTVTSSSSSSKQQQYATKVPSEKSAASFLKEALLVNSSSPKISGSPLAVDNMINKSSNSPKPKTTTNTTNVKPTTATTNTTTVKTTNTIVQSPTTTNANANVTNTKSTSAIIQSPTASNIKSSNTMLQSPTTSNATTTKSSATIMQSPTTNTQRSSSSSHKSSSNRSSIDYTHHHHHHRSDQQHQQAKTPSSSSRSQSNTTSSSSNSSTSRLSTSGFSSSLDQQSNRSHSSSIGIPTSLSQTIPWDPATLQLAAAALANPQLLNSSVFDPSLFSSVFATAANIVSSNQSSPSSSSRHQSTNNNRRIQ